MLRQTAFVCLIGLMVGMMDVNACCAASKTAVKSPTKAKPRYVWVYVKDMHCANCAKKITRKLYAVPGVIKVQTNVKKSFAVITPQTKKEIPPRAAWQAVENAGFQPIKLITPRRIYTKKPPKPSRVARKRK